MSIHKADIVFDSDDFRSALCGAFGREQQEAAEATWESHSAEQGNPLPSKRLPKPRPISSRLVKMYFDIVLTAEEECALRQLTYKHNGLPHNLKQPIIDQIKTILADLVPK